MYINTHTHSYREFTLVLLGGMKIAVKRVEQSFAAIHDHAIQEKRRRRETTVARMLTENIFNQRAKLYVELCYGPGCCLKTMIIIASTNRHGHWCFNTMECLVCVYVMYVYGMYDFMHLLCRCVTVADNHHDFASIDSRIQCVDW